MLAERTAHSDRAFLPVDSEMRPARVAIAAGGTAGHVNAGLAIAEAFESVGEAVLFLGAADGMESELIGAASKRLLLLPGAPFTHRDLFGKWRSLQLLGSGIREARRRLCSEGIQLVVGFGGYTSVAPILAAHSLGIPAVLHEANTLPGLANRLLARFVDRVYLEHDAARWAFPYVASEVIGTPVRRAILQCRSDRRSADAARLLRIAVIGGSTGCSFLNRHVPRLLAELAAQGIPNESWHLAGREPTRPIEDDYRRLSITARVSGFEPAIHEIYRWADFAIVCSGALTLAELATTGLPALLVPLQDAADDHQAANARRFAQASTLPWLRERDWDSRGLAARLAPLLGDSRALTALSRRVASLARPRAAEDLVSDCRSLLPAA